MNPTERIELWAGIGFIIGGIGSWAFDCSPLRIIAWAAFLTVTFALATVRVLAIEAADRRAHRPVVTREHSNVHLVEDRP